MRSAQNDKEDKTESAKNSWWNASSEFFLTQNTPRMLATGLTMTVESYQVMRSGFRFEAAVPKHNLRCTTHWKVPHLHPTSAPESPAQFPMAQIRFSNPSVITAQAYSSSRVACDMREKPFSLRDSIVSQKGDCLRSDRSISNLDFFENARMSSPQKSFALAAHHLCPLASRSLPHAEFGQFTAVSGR
jgi:hypothetical protein